MEIFDLTAPGQGFKRTTTGPKKSRLWPTVADLGPYRSHGVP